MKKQGPGPCFFSGIVLDAEHPAEHAGKAARAFPDHDFHDASSLLCEQYDAQRDQPGAAQDEQQRQRDQPAEDGPNAKPQAEHADQIAAADHGVSHSSHTSV